MMVPVPEEAPTIMARPCIAPETKADDSGHSAFRERTVTTHPAFAQIQANRVSGGAYLYGSDFHHQNYISITLRRSELHRDLYRDLSRDWHSAGEEMVEVALSEAQWATFISTLNNGSGIPCTLQHIDRTWVPSIEMTADRKPQFAGEHSKRLDRAMAALETLNAQIDAVGLSGKKRDELKGTLEAAVRDLGGNLDFVRKQFGEHIEKVTEHAKIEVEAYAQATIQRAGLAAIASGSPIQLDPPTPANRPALEGGSTDQPE